MAEVNFDSLLEACIEALDGYDDFLEPEALALLEAVDEWDWVNAR